MEIRGQGWFLFLLFLLLCLYFMSVLCLEGSSGEGKLGEAEKRGTAGKKGSIPGKGLTFNEV